MGICGTQADNIYKLLKRDKLLFLIDFRALNFIEFNCFEALRNEYLGNYQFYSIMCKRPFLLLLAQRTRTKFVLLKIIEFGNLFEVCLFKQYLTRLPIGNTNFHVQGHLSNILHKKNFVAIIFPHQNPLLPGLITT